MQNSYDKEEEFFIEAVKGHEDFALKYSDIVNGPDRPLMKMQKIRRLTGDYYQQSIRSKTSTVQNNVSKNLETLSDFTGKKATPTNINRYMGTSCPEDLFDYWTNDFRSIHAIRSFVFISEFYCVPLEMLMFQDIRAIYGTKQNFEEEYASLVRQSRH